MMQTLSLSKIYLIVHTFNYLCSFCADISNCSSIEIQNNFLSWNTKCWFNPVGLFHDFSPKFNNWNWLSQWNVHAGLVPHTMFVLSFIGWIYRNYSSKLNIITKRTTWLSPIQFQNGDYVGKKLFYYKKYFLHTKVPVCLHIRSLTTLDIVLPLCCSHFCQCWQPNIVYGWNNPVDE